MRFGFIRSDFGLDTSVAPATMVVPVGGDNFILVQDAAAVRFETKSSRIEIREIVDAQELGREISRIRFIGLGLGDSVPRKLIEFLVGVHSVITQDAGKLFKIHADSGGFAEVNFLDKAKKTSLKLNVYMLQNQPFSVDIRFPLALDGNGQKYRLSAMPSAHAKAWLDEVNIIFGPQLNITFKLSGTSEPSIDEKIVTVTPDHWDWLKQHGNKDPKTITVYLAKSIRTEDKNHPLGISLRNKSRVILLQDRDSEDELVKTLAHEFGHTVGDMKGFDVGHPGGPGELMVAISRFDGVRISGELVTRLGKQ